MIETVAVIIVGLVAFGLLWWAFSGLDPDDQDEFDRRQW